MYNFTFFSADVNLSVCHASNIIWSMILSFYIFQISLPATKNGYKCECLKVFLNYIILTKWHWYVNSNKKSLHHICSHIFFLLKIPGIMFYFPAQRIPCQVYLHIFMIGSTAYRQSPVVIICFLSAILCCICCFSDFTMFICPNQIFITKNTIFLL